MCAANAPLIAMILRCFRAPQLTIFAEWSAGLRLATKRNFADIRALAIQRLEGLATSVDRIVLVHAFDISQ